VAGLKGLYHGTAAVLDQQPFESLTVTFDGKGVPGFVRGSAAITLSVEGEGTLFVCDADVQVGGVIAAVGSRLVQAAARKLAEAFFRQLRRELGAGEEPPIEEEPELPE
jgi:carbon monoxide dehydrogenase subunit G